MFELSYEGIKKTALMLGLIQARLMPLLLLLPFMSRNLVPRTVVFGVAAGIGLLVLPILPESLVVRTDMTLLFIVAKEAFVGLMVFRSVSPYSFEIRRSTGMFVTKSGSPMYWARSANARRIDSVMRCRFLAEPYPFALRSYPSRMLSIVMTPMPPELGGAMPMIS